MGLDADDIISPFDVASTPSDTGDGVIETVDDVEVTSEAVEGSVEITSDPKDEDASIISAATNVDS